MRRPWLRAWSCGATRQRCTMAGPKNIVDLPGRPSTSSDRSISSEVSSDEWAWRIDTTSDVIVRSPEASRRDGLGGNRGYARPGHR
jgi:hypothetical protein